MTLVVETSALVKRYVSEAGTDLVAAAMERDTDWVACAVAHSEAALALCYSTLSESESADARRKLDEEWNRFRILPVDGPCLARAIEIGCGQRIRTLDAIHLAAADRLPRPFTLLSFDRRLVAAARAMGIEVTGAG